MTDPAKPIGEEALLDRLYVVSRIRDAETRKAEARALLAAYTAKVREEDAKAVEAVDCLVPVNESTKWPDAPLPDDRWVRAVCATAERTRAACAAAIRAASGGDDAGQA